MMVSAVVMMVAEPEAEAERKPRPPPERVGIGREIGIGRIRIGVGIWVGVGDGRRRGRAGPLRRIVAGDDPPMAGGVEARRPDGPLRLPADKAGRRVFA